MTITLMRNTSAPNVVNKNVSTIETLNGTLRAPSSIVDPVITIERSSPTGFNYAHIPEFNRYYFVTNVVSVSDGIVSLSMHVDVLMTYASEIRSISAVIRRQENLFNLYLDDGIFKAYSNSKWKIIRFPYEFNTYSFALALGGNGEQT